MSKNRAPRAAAAKGRFDRDRWLAEALEILSREGSARITVRHLSERLGVTTGSFYWHFEDRRDFVRRIVDYWSEAFTETAIRYFSDVSDDPQKQLLALMTILTEQDLARYDVGSGIFREGRSVWPNHDTLRRSARVSSPGDTG